MVHLPQPSTLAPHNDFVNELAEQVAAFHASKTPFRIYHGNTNSTRVSTKTSKTSLDVSTLSHVIRVFPNTKTCLCEPNVSMESLLFSTMQHKLMPPVVPEFRGITVGGAFAGTAGESSSFKYGFFDRCVTWVEMILADGTIVNASPTERPDLFYGSAGTFGTLGVVTLLEVRLIEAQRYMTLDYHPVDSISAAIKTTSELMEADKSGTSPIAFLDGIMFSPTSGVIMSGTFRPDPSSEQKVTTFYAASDPWFYLHAQSRAANPESDTIPLTSYIFRYDRGAFWTGRHAFTYFMTPFNWVTRYLLDDFMNTRIMYHALHRSGLTNQFIIQDMATPASRMEVFSDWLDSPEGGCNEIYPRWLCPLKAGETISMSPHFDSQKPAASGKLSSGGDDFLLNIGLWGPLPPSAASNQLTINRAIEAKLASLEGMKWLYAQTFYTEQEFWRIYDRKWYDELRVKYNAQTLPDVYQKVGPRAEVLDRLAGGGAQMGWYEWVWETVWPLKGIYGVLSAVKGGDYLRKRG
ncbi:Delta(24)-sterol [Cyphellophora attinorum]|uniref:Delta(24)-sterol reductase n=1 Tax=Cyphellophora attinorum TaxID=1664694 RepID=A0A0N1H0L5_9EURO|nr:Delta(24)-sterol [Phialophora attinorum]KPI37464.1 Delta(24)-sterol [Phialophora attinorum]